MLIRFLFVGNRRTVTDTPEQMDALQKGAGILVNPEFGRTYEEEYPKDH